MTEVCELWTCVYCRVCLTTYLLINPEALYVASCQSFMYDVTVSKMKQVLDTCIGDSSASDSVKEGV